jgi:N-acetyl-anhydromuramyl-L-alanine amidase AmpD
MIIDSKTYQLNEKNYVRKESVKNLIVLGHTNNSDMKHFIGWQTRLGGKYKKTAHFTISKKGVIYQHFDAKYSTKYFSNQSLNDRAIIILLENEGYLNKDSKTNEFITWLGDIYKEKNNIIEKKWRNLNFWVGYSQEQFESAINLINNLCVNFEIPKKTMNHNTKINDLGSFKGVVYKANLEKFYTDLNPSWNFQLFKTKIENDEREN